MLIGATAAASALVVLANRSDFPAAWAALRGSSLPWLVVLVALVACYLLDLGLRHVVAQRAVGLRPDWRPMLPTAWATSFVNAISKSGGFAGIAVLVAEARRSGKSRAAVIAAALLVAVLDQLAFAMVLPFAILVLVLGGRFNAGDGAAVAVFAVYVVVTLTAVLAATRSRGSVRALYALPGRFATSVRRTSRRRTVTEEPVATERADELYDAIALLRGELRSVVPAALGAVAIDLLAILQLWAALLAVGVHVGPAQPFVAYSVSTLFALVGIVPGGIGVVELSVGAVLHSFGTPLAPVAAAVVLFRTAEFWIPLAVGAISSRRFVHSAAGPT
jgi:uncharacterized protein (TIRG00374 family)